MRKVWAHRCLAGVWCAIGAASFAFGWSDSVALIWAASVYANVMSSLSAAEAADDGAVLRELHALRAEVSK